MGFHRIYKNDKTVERLIGTLKANEPLQQLTHVLL